MATDNLQPHDKHQQASPYGSKPLMSRATISLNKPFGAHIRSHINPSVMPIRRFVSHAAILLFIASAQRIHALHSLRIWFIFLRKLSGLMPSRLACSYWEPVSK
jgi:hypothetical protein